MALPVATAHKETALFSLLLWFFWAGIVSVEGFLLPYLTEQGFPPSQAGLVMSALFLCAIPGQPFWGHVCDRLGTHRPIFLGVILTGAAALLFIPLAIPRLPLVIGITMIYSVTVNSMPGNLDGWIMARRRLVPKIEYGMARAMGSFGFALWAILLGTLYDRWGLHLIFPVFGLFALLAAGVALFTPDSGSLGITPPWASSPMDCGSAASGISLRDSTSSAVPASSSPSSFTQVVRLVWDHRPYRIFVLSSILLFTAFRATYTFLPLLIAEVGGGNRHIGWAHSVGAATEIPVMIMAGFLLRKIRPEKTILAAMIIMTIRMSFYAFVRSPGAIIALQGLHGLSFGLFLASSVYYIEDIAPAGSKSLFQALAPSMYFGLGSVLGSSLGGVVVDTLGLRVLFGLAPLGMAGAALIFYSKSRTTNPGKNRLNPGGDRSP
ncbi:MFS_1 like family protein [Alkalispirochaeta americana]|uniref:MFS_1 like family protein n=1 Tax=Alkalispirochaeta americana TaxID=159291 RepID=A0A1N6TJC7_9SPIO|nr:MFS transporter [Alkalispirochaeta americana]SIQ53433.1 MFS_1 like family protein [Alkalispirochaeta americana]